MKIRLTQMFGATLMISGVALLTASCGNLMRDHADLSAAPSRPRSIAQQQRIAQLHFGRQAEYAVCVEPACPSVTPKTVASAAPAPTLSMAPTLLPAAGDAVESAPAAIDSASAAAAPTRAHLMLKFQLGASTLDMEAKHAIDQFIPIARQAEQIVIMGRTDNVGSTKANDSIALARALHVRDYLRNKMSGATNPIEIDAKGSCCFLSNNDTRAGRQENRRVEVVFTIRG